MTLYEIEDVKLRASYFYNLAVTAFGVGGLGIMVAVALDPALGRISQAVLVSLVSVVFGYLCRWRGDVILAKLRDA